MSCRKHFLMFHWDRHDWERRVVQAEDVAGHETDQWSRVVPHAYVNCHVQYVCRSCGTVRDGEDCDCDKERADSCPARLAYLAETKTRDAADVSGAAITS
jgi:hypothetical protein